MFGGGFSPSLSAILQADAWAIAVLINKENAGLLKGGADGLDCAREEFFAALKACDGVG